MRCLLLLLLVCLALGCSGEAPMQSGVGELTDVDASQAASSPSASPLDQEPPSGMPKTPNESDLLADLDADQPVEPSPILSDKTAARDAAANDTVARDTSASSIVASDGSLIETDSPPIDPNPDMAGADPEEILSQAHQAHEDEEFEQAARLADMAVQASEDADLHVSAAEILIRSQQIGRGIEVLESVLRNDSSRAQLHLMLTSAYRLQARTSESVEEQANAIGLAEQHLLNAGKRGVLAKYKERGSKLAALTLMEKAKINAVAKRTDTALMALADLASLAIVDIERLSLDPVFDDVRSHRDFGKVLQAYRDAMDGRLLAGAQDAIAKTTPYAFNFALQDYEGNKVSSEDFAGKVMLVDFWGTWCGPCRMTTPNLVALHHKYGNDLAVVGIAYEKSPPGTWADLIQKYVEEHNVPYPALIGDQRTKARVMNLDAFPTMLFVDRDGKVRLQLAGYREFELLEAVVRVLIDAPN